MKKLFAVLALVGVMTSCKSKKKDEKKPEETTTTTDATTTPTDATTTTATTAGVPTFSDPEVQKFANEYGAFIAEYKTGMKDPAKMVEMGKSMTEWSTKAQSIALKLAKTPEEATKWGNWAMELSKSLMSETK